MGRSNNKLFATMAALSCFAGGHGLDFSNNHDYPKTKTEKLIDECHTIKGLSAKEMGTAGKKKLSRSKRKVKTKKHK